MVPGIIFKGSRKRNPIVIHSQTAFEVPKGPDLFQNGVTATRQKRHEHGKGRTKSINIKDVYKPPKKGYLLVSSSNEG